MAENAAPDPHAPDHTLDVRDVTDEEAVEEAAEDAPGNATSQPVHPVQPGRAGGDFSRQPVREATTALSDQAWLLSLWRPVLISILSGCLVVAFVAFVRRFVPELPAVYTQLLVVLGLGAALIGCISTTWLAQPGQRAKRSVAYRAAELALILAITRVGIWAATGTWPGFELILRPLDALLDGYFIVGAFAVLMAWIMATAFTNDMLGMALRADDLYMARTYTDRWQDTARPVYTDRPAILRGFTGRWVIGGIFLVLLAAGSHIDRPQPGFFLPVMQQNVDRGVILSVIVYFMTGLVLISQGQLALLRARWTLQKTPSAPNVLRNWPFYVLILIVVVGVIAALLPLGGTFHLARIITAVFEAIYLAIFSIFRFFLSLFLLLASLFGGGEEEVIAPTPEPLPQFTPEAPPPPPVQIPPWAGGTVFWIAAALVLGYAAYIYFSGKGVNFDWLRRLWEMLRDRWASVTDAYEQWQVSRVRITGEEEGGATGKRGGGLLSWLGNRNLSPEQQVRYYYLSLLEQADEAGHPRRQSETPLQYGPRLAAEIAQEDEDRAAIDALTESFVGVRYAHTPVQAEDLPPLRRWWDRLKRLLRL